MSGPLVSVVVPAYNSAWSIERTLDSIRRQSLRDIEILIVNDGSTDDLHARIARAVAEDERIRVIDQENRGLAGARNRGVSESRAALVAPIDADDIWEPSFLATMVAALQAHPEAPFAYAYSFRMNERDRRLPHIVLKRPPRHDLIGLLALNSVGNGSAAVYRRDAVLAAGGYDITMARRAAPGAEDWKLVLALAAGGTPVLVPEFLVGYRLVGTSMSRADPRKQMSAVLQAIADARTAYPDVPARAFADARTMMTGWLLPAYLARRMWREALTQAWWGYGRNPLWFTTPAVRDVHLGWVCMKLRSSARAILGITLRRSGS